MGWDDLQAGLGDIQHSTQESTRFGVSLSRLTIGFGWREQLLTVEALYEALGRALDQATDDIVVVRAPSDLVRIASATRSQTRSALAAGCLMYWEVSIDALSREALPPGFAVRMIDRSSMTGADTVGLTGVISDSFDGYVNHYSYDPLLGEHLVVAGYTEWAVSALQNAGGSAFELTLEGELIGFATTRSLPALPGIAEIELAGLIATAQGSGRYRSLLVGIAIALRATGFTKLVISTQSQNVRVQRAWAAAGFRPMASVDTSHWIREGRLGPIEGAGWVARH